MERSTNLASLDSTDMVESDFADYLSNLEEYDLGDPYSYRSIANFAPELIIGGPPCQDFSSAGKRNENLGRANLTRAFADIICLLQPT